MPPERNRSLRAIANTRPAPPTASTPRRAIHRTVRHGEETRVNGVLVTIRARPGDRNKFRVTVRPVPDAAPDGIDISSSNDQKTG